MAISRDSFAGRTQSTGATNWTALSINVSASANIAIVLVSLEGSEGITVTFDGQAMTPVPNGLGNQNGNMCQAFWLPNPPTGNGKSVVVTVTGNFGGHVFAWTGIGAETESAPRAFTAAATATSVSATATGTSDGSMFLTGANLNDNLTASPTGTGHTQLFQASGGFNSNTGCFGEKGPVTPAANQTLGWSRGASSSDNGLVLLEILAAPPSEPDYEQTDYQFFNDDGTGLGEAA